MDLDRQAIERRDFPIARRGYDAAAVDAHLRALAVEVEELQRQAATGGGGLSMASNAGAQVQTIIETAEASAAEIERHANERARQVRESAERDAELTRQEAIDRARAHVNAVGEVAASLLERVGGMDGEARALVESLRQGASRMAGDLAAVEASMTELYDAASGRAGEQQPAPAPTAAFPPLQAPSAEAAPQPQPPLPVGRAPQPPAAPAPSAFDAQLAGAMGAAPAPEADEPEFTPDPYLPAEAYEPEAEPAHERRFAPEPQPPLVEPGAGAAEPAPALEADLDGARLIALNMALNGESRAVTERYLIENFAQLDHASLVDEVYAAIEG